MPRCYPVIPTRERPEQIVAQISRLLPQLADGERLFVVVDGDPETAGKLVGVFTGNPHLTVIALTDPMGVDAARRVGTAFVPDDGIVVELDDHDPIEPTLLQEVRAAFADRQVKITYCDCWMTDPEFRVKTLREKAEGQFREHGNLGLGMRAYRKWIYDAVGGYPLDYFPANDLALLCMMDQLTDFAGRKRIAKPLVKVILDSRGISATHKEAQEKAVERLFNVANNGAGFRLPYKLQTPTRPKPTVRVLTTSAAQAPVHAVAGERAKPHVVFVGEMWGRGFGGGELSLMALLRKLSDRCRISVVYFKDAGETPETVSWATLHKLPIERYRAHSTMPDAASSMDTEPLLAHIKPDVLVTEVRTAPWLIEMGERLRVPVLTLVQFWHNLLVCTDETLARVPSDGQVPLDIVDGESCRVMRRSTALVANSEFTAGVLHRILGRPANAVVYPPVDAAAVVAPTPVPVHERRYVVCPSGQWRKGSRVFLDLAERHPELQFLLLAGDSRHSGEDDVIARGKALPNVTVRADWVTDMREVYRDCRLLYIGTLTAETFSRGGAEARANGIPLLVSDSGNLPNMAGGGHGVVVRRGAPIEEWDAALAKAGALRPTPDASMCTDHSARFAQAVDDVRRLSEVGIAVPDGPGVQSACVELRDVLGVRPLSWPPSPEEAASCALTIFPGSFNGELAASVKGKLAFWWCSHFAQMDSSRHELTALHEALAHVRSTPHRYWFTTHAADALAWGQVLGPRKISHLPVVMAVGPFQPRRRSGRGVFIPGPYGTRKNCFAALAAIRLAGGEAHVTARAQRQAQELEVLANDLGVKLHIHDCPTRSAVQGAMGACAAAVALSTAETYCLAAAECVAAGLPVVAWPGIPSLRGGPSALMVDDPSDVTGVARAIQQAFDAQDLPAQQHAAWAKVATGYNAKARAALLEVLHD